MPLSLYVFLSVFCAGLIAVSAWLEAYTREQFSYSLRLSRQFRLLNVVVLSAALAVIPIAALYSYFNVLAPIVVGVCGVISVGIAVYLWHDIVANRSTFLADQSAQSNAALLQTIDETRRRLRDLTEISGDWIWQTDERGCLTYVSEGVRTLQGRDPSEYIGKPVFGGADFTMGEAEYSALRTQIEKRLPIRNFMLEYRDRSGSVGHLRFNGKPLVDEQGRFLGYHGFGSDVTSDVMLRDAKASAKAKDSFFAAMSHEIRTPMNGVLGVLELLSEENLGEDQQGLVRTAQESGAALLHIINDILDFSKIQAGHLQLSPKETDLGGTIRASVNSLTPLAEKNGNALRLAMDPMMPDRVVVDGHRFRQVLVNFIGNAIKFTHNGLIEVVVSCGPAIEGMAKIKVSVKDNGMGISKAKLGLLFKEFSMLDDPERNNASGTGLGLALSKKLIESMGGTVGVESEIGAGSTFWCECTLPVAEVDAAAEQDNAQAGVSENYVPRGLRILLAEDNPTNALIATRMLNADLNSIVHVTDGRQALEAYERQAFDVILMDVSMPELDGVAVTSEIRRREASGTVAVTPIIALTAHAIESEKQRVLDAGVSAYLTKPIRKMALMRELANFVGHEPTSSEAVAEAVGERLEEKPTAGSDAATAAAANRAQGAEPVGASVDKSKKPAGEILNRRVFAELAAEIGSRQNLLNLIGIFRKEILSRAEMLEQAKVQGDIKLFENTCHAIAGSAATLGAERLQLIAKRCEEACLQKSDTRYLALVDIVQREITLVLNLLPKVDAPGVQAAAA